MGDELNFGPPQGLKIPSLDVTNDVVIRGSASVTGTLTTGATVNNGVIEDDVEIAAGYDLTMASGDGKVDLSSGTGVFKSNTGANTLGGDVTIASGKDLLFAGGDSKADLSGGSGVTKTTTGAVTIGPGAVGITGDVTITAGKKLTKGVTIERVLTKTADYTVTDTDPDLVFIGAITALANTTITLPTAADNTGRSITVVIAGDPGSNDVIIEGEGAETINGAANKTNSDQYSMIKMVCDGTGWYITGSAGTWT